MKFLRSRIAPLSLAAGLALSASCGPSTDEDIFAAACEDSGVVCFQTTGTGWTSVNFLVACETFSGGAGDVDECTASGVLNRCTDASYVPGRKMTVYFYAGYAGDKQAVCDGYGGTLQ